MKRYPSYKDSGIAWIGQVPEHWEKRRYKDVLTQVDEKVGDHPITLLSLSKNGGVIVRDLSENKGKFPKDFTTYKIVSPRNLVMCLFDVDETPLTVGLSMLKGMITGAYDIFSIQNINEKYIEYHLIDIDNRKGFRPLYKGLRKTVPTPGFLGSYIYIPPIAEQEAIVRFIEDKVEKIDRYVSEKQRQVAALDELRQAEIARAVTRGLNPDVPLRDSGNDWIGSIPEHWDVEPMGRHFEFSKGLNITKANLTSSGVAVISYGQIHNKANTGVSISPELIRFVPMSYLESNPECLLRTDDFIFADTSEDVEGSGNCAFNDYDGKIFAGYHTVIARPKDLVYPKFTAYLFKSNPWKHQVHQNVNAVKVFSIGRTVLKKTSIIIPPLSEQQAIVEYLDKKTADIDRMKTQIIREIELLKEYKQRLISDAVTGQIDVRDYNPVTCAD